MTRTSQSQYIRVDKNNILLKKWIAATLLKADLEDYLVFQRIDRRVLTAFNTSQLTKDNREDAKHIRAWLRAEYKSCGAIAFDEGDAFSINTRRIKTLVGLSRIELSILRFSILLNCCPSLMSATEIYGTDLTEIDVCDLLHRILGESVDSLYDALNPLGLLRKSGLVKLWNRNGCTLSLTGWLQVPDTIIHNIFRTKKNVDSLEQMLFTPALQTTLAMKDFKHLEPKISLIKDYLKASYKTGDAGANILLWGPPGTGKTELARYLAQSVRKKALEVNTVDENLGPLSSSRRFECYQLCQTIFGRTKRSLLIYDEVEDALSDRSFSEFGFKSTSTITKGLINHVLETNPLPAIWITNTLSGVDPAYLRRFDIALRMKMPMTNAKKRIARNAFKELPVSKEIINDIAEHRAITPAHLNKASRICARLGVGTTRDANFVVQQVLGGDLEALYEKPLSPKQPSVTKAPELAYLPGLINSNMDMAKMSEFLDTDSSARICLYGPPGTGKTAWAHYLAKTIKRPLLVKRAADILDCYIGGTEKNIVSAFKQAISTRSVLLLDEVDSFLQDRSQAIRHWEITQVNQFLTAMEQYTGILICTTNLMDNLDPATLRRFDFKVCLDYMTTDQAQKMALNLFAKLDVKLKKADKAQLYSAIGIYKLSHGDFAALFRRYSVLKSTPGVDTLIADLETETSFREKDSMRAIGFMASV